MANITTEITHLTIEDTGYGHTNVSVQDVKNEDFLLVKIDELEIKVELGIALAICTELAEQFKFGLVDLDSLEIVGNYCDDDIALMILILERKLRGGHG